MRSRVRLWFNAIALLVGLVAFSFVVRTLGWDGIERAVAGAGGWFAVIAVVDLVSVLCDAFAIHGLLAGAVPYWKVFAAEASGISINRLTPGNTLGEPVKIAMLTRDTTTSSSVAAVVMFNLLTMYVGIAAIAFGVPITALLLDLPREAAIVAWIGLAVIVAFAGAVALLIQRGATTTLIHALERVRVISQARGASWSARLSELDAQLRQLGGTNRRHVQRGLAGVLGSRVCNWLGTILVIRACGIAATPSLVVAMLSVGILVTWFSNIVPLGLAVADGTNYVLYQLLGATSAEGLVFTMVNRVRTVVLALMGLTVMAIANLTRRS